MKVLFIYPPVTRPKDFSAKAVRVSVFFPMGIAYLLAVLERAGGHETAAFDALSEGDIDEGRPMDGGERLRYGLSDEAIARKIADFAPDVVGVACLFSAMQWDAENVCRLVKQAAPAARTVLGGAHAGCMAEEILREEPAADFVLLGEAEESFPALLAALKSGGSFSKLDGIAYRADGGVRLAPKTRYISDIDAIPFPARHRFDMTRYFTSAKSHGFFRNAPFTQMITSRGCPYKCAFCALDAHWGSRQRLRSAGNVLAEIELLVERYGIRELHFEDDNLTADKKRALELFEGMTQRGFHLSWHVPSGMAVNTLDERLLEKMRESGCYSVTLAIESGDPEVVRKLMNKPVDFKRVPGLVKKIRALGMDVRGFFMIGYPGETRDTIRRTIEYAKELELDWSYFSITSPIPKTAMYRTCIEKGYIKEGDFDPIRSFHRSIIRTPEFTPELLREIREEAIIDVCFRNNPNLLKYDLDRAIADFSSVVNHYPHFDFANFYLGEAYRKKGDIPRAVESYQNTLKANPAHAEARRRLQELHHD